MQRQRKFNAYGNPIIVEGYEFTEQERAFVRAHYKVMSYSKIAKALGRSKNSICGWLNRNGLRKKERKNA